MSKNSPQGHSGTIVITSAQWGRIEGACGFSFSPLLQADIVRASEAYLLAERFGRTGDFLAKVKVILESHDKAATRFFKELFADHSAVSDAGVYAHYLIENNFKASQLGKDAPGLDAFLNLLRAFHIACNTSIKQLNDASSSSVARNEDAWAMWVSRLAEILKETKCRSPTAKIVATKAKLPNHLCLLCLYGNSKSAYQPNVDVIPSRKWPFQMRSA